MPKYEYTTYKYSVDSFVDLILTHRNLGSCDFFDKKFVKEKLQEV